MCAPQKERYPAAGRAGCLSPPAARLGGPRLPLPSLPLSACARAPAHARCGGGRRSRGQSGGRCTRGRGDRLRHATAGPNPRHPRSDAQEPHTHITRPPEATPMLGNLCAVKPNGEKVQAQAFAYADTPPNDAASKSLLLCLLASSSCLPQLLLKGFPSQRSLSTSPLP